MIANRATYPHDEHKPPTCNDRLTAMVGCNQHMERDIVLKNCQEANTQMNRQTVDEQLARERS